MPCGAAKILESNAKFLTLRQLRHRIGHSPSAERTAIWPPTLRSSERSMRAAPEGWAVEGTEDLDRGCKDGSEAFLENYVDEFERRVACEAIKMESVRVARNSTDHRRQSSS